MYTQSHDIYYSQENPYLPLLKLTVPIRAKMVSSPDYRLSVILKTPLLHPNSSQQIVIEVTPTLHIPNEIELDTDFFDEVIKIVTDRLIKRGVDKLEYLHRIQLYYKDFYITNGLYKISLLNYIYKTYRPDFWKHIDLITLIRQEHKFDPDPDLVPYLNGFFNKKTASWTKKINLLEPQFFKGTIEGIEYELGPPILECRKCMRRQKEKLIPNLEGIVRFKFLRVASKELMKINGVCLTIKKKIATPDLHCEYSKIDFISSVPIIFKPEPFFLKVATPKGEIQLKIQQVFKDHKHERFNVIGKTEDMLLQNNFSFKKDKGSIHTKTYWKILNGPKGTTIKNITPIINALSKYLGII